MIETRKWTLIKYSLIKTPNTNLVSHPTKDFQWLFPATIVNCGVCQMVTSHVHHFFHICELKFFCKEELPLLNCLFVHPPGPELTVELWILCTRATNTSQLSPLLRVFPGCSQGVRDCAFFWRFHWERTASKLVGRGWVVQGPMLLVVK